MIKRARNFRRVFIFFSILTLSVFCVAIPIAFGSSWSAASNLSQNSTDSVYPSVAADMNGNLHAVWRDSDGSGNQEIYYRKFSAASSAWGSTRNISNTPYVSASNTGNSDQPSVASDKYGNVHVVWMDYLNGNLEIYYVKYDNSSGSWGSRLNISDSFLASKSPSIVSDQAGNLYAVWEESGDIYYAKNAGGIWGAPQPLPYTIEPEEKPRVAVDSSGRVSVVWQGDVKHATDPPAWHSEIFYCQSLDGISWGSMQQLSASEPSNSVNPSVTADVSNKIYVVWESLNEIYLRKSSNGLSWSSLANLSNTATASNQPSIASDRIGRVHLVWSEYTGNWEIYYKKFSSSSWGVNTNISNTAGVSRTPAITADATTNPKVLWQDDTDYSGVAFDTYYKGMSGPILIYSTGFEQSSLPKWNFGDWNIPSSTATFTFTGTSVTWIGAKYTNRGIAKVYIDDVYQQDVDLYASSWQAQAELYTKSGLTDSSHTIKIEVAGTKNASSSNYYISVDAFDVSEESGTNRYEETDPAVTYMGTWASGSDASHSGGTHKYSNANLDYWGRTNISGAAHNGSYGLWCAAVGTNSTAGEDANTSVLKYDKGMNAYARLSVDLTLYQSASLTFYYKVPSVEAGSPSADAGWLYVRDLNGDPLGSALGQYDTVVSGWQAQAFDLSQFTGQPVILDWVWVSDGDDEVAEGMYIDDVTVTGMPLSVAGVSPNVRSNDKAYGITITGTGFRSTPTVHIGITTATGVTRVDATELTATVPAGLAYGTYDVVVTNPGSATATLYYGYKVSIAGDINGDGRVSLVDLAILAAAYGSQSGDPNYNANADLNGDNRVSLTDLAILAANYGGSL